MSFTPALDANGFPVDPIVDDLPAGLTDGEQLAFAVRVMGEQGHRIGDYLHAAVMQALAQDGLDSDLFNRWIAMSELMETLNGKPITLTYRACERREAQGRNVPH